MPLRFNKIIPDAARWGRLQPAPQILIQLILKPAMYLKILAHPVFVNLNFHLPMIVDLYHPLIMLTGENGSGKSTLLHSILYALKG